MNKPSFDNYHADVLIATPIHPTNLQVFLHLNREARSRNYILKITLHRILGRIKGIIYIYISSIYVKHAQKFSSKPIRHVSFLLHRRDKNSEYQTSFSKDRTKLMENPRSVRDTVFFQKGGGEEGGGGRRRSCIFTHTAGLDVTQDGTAPRRFSRPAVYFFKHAHTTSTLTKFEALYFSHRRKRPSYNAGS